MHLYKYLKQKKQHIILFTNARNEKNIKEWAAHHLLIGFDLIYIFDHKSQISLKDVFKNFDKRVIIESCNINKAPKLKLMNRAAYIARILKADWLLYLDADEFLILPGYVGVKQLLYQYYFVDSLAINWVIFGSNNHVREPDGLILDNYTKSNSELSNHVKSIVRTNQILNATNPHWYNIKNPNKMYSVNCKSMKNTLFFNDWNISFNNCNAFIAHYIYQSEETYKNRKLLLPTDDTGIFRTADNNFHNQFNEVTNLLPKEKYSDIVKRFLNYWDKVNN